jgi:low affinity Fe/Cu permease
MEVLNQEIKEKNLNKIEDFFERLAIALSKFTGSTMAFVLATLSIILWIVTGPVFNYSEGWQLVINTGTTIITFLMVFLIQRAQNKDALAIQLKLDEVIAALTGASNRLIDVEALSEKDLENLKRNYKKLSVLYSNGNGSQDTHSIEETDAKPKKKRKEKINCGDENE